MTEETILRAVGSTDINLTGGGATVPGATIHRALDVRAVSHSFPGGASGSGPFCVLSDVGFALEPSHVVGVVGESGCGKTTLGRIAAGLLKPTRGEVHITGVDPYRADRDAWLALRREVRMIFQSPAAALNPFLKVRDLCEEPIRIHEPQIDKRTRRRRVEELAERFDFRRLDQYPRSLSGGEKRRASLVRALAVPFKVLIADEPTSGLDTALEVQILGTIESFRKQWNAGMLLISHHLGIVEFLADRILVLFGGQVMEDAHNEDRRFVGLHPYTKELWQAARLEFGKSAQTARIMFDAPRGVGCVYREACAMRATLGARASNRCESERPALRSAGNRGEGHMVACHHFDL